MIDQNLFHYLKAMVSKLRPRLWLVHQAHRALLVPQVLQEVEVIMEPLVLLVTPAVPASLVTQVNLVPLVSVVPLVITVVLANLVLLDTPELRVNAV